MKEKFELSRRKALVGLGTIGAASAGAGLGTSALFSDTETFEDNTITAGTSNLEVEMGLVSASNPDLMDINFEEKETKTKDGEARVAIEVGDMKPGDCLTLRQTVRVLGNPMYVAAFGEVTEDDENGQSDPEMVGSVPDNSSSAADSFSGFGDLDNEIQATIGWDSDRTSLHDNTLEGDIESEWSGSLADFLEQLSTEYGLLYRGRKGSDGDPPGGHGPHETEEGDPVWATRIGEDSSQANVDRTAVTHFKQLCLPKEVGNNVQGDSIAWDVEFRAEQVRNNPRPWNGGEVDGQPQNRTD